MDTDQQPVMLSRDQLLRGIPGLRIGFGTYLYQKRLLWDHLPSPELFRAVDSNSPDADELIRLEIRTLTGYKATQGSLTYYRRRIETWIRLAGLPICCEIASWPR